MAVGEQRSIEVHPVTGIRMAAVASNIRYADRLDLVLIEIAERSTVAGVYTQNVFCAAPVKIAKQHSQKKSCRSFLINTGNANAGTGEAGVVAALRCCQAVADIAGLKLAEVLPFSTGVIGEELPADKIVLGIPDAYTNLSESNWHQAAQGIMTTDTRPKLASVQVEIEGKLVTITGIAKGSGMIKPNMATMLGFVFTDAKIDRSALSSLLTNAVNLSFNRVTVDGDTSTNDCCMLVATGASQLEIHADNRLFAEALNLVFTELATGLIKDAEGATKFITIKVNQGASIDECLRVAYTVAESPLVKIAFFASDPNWGRILAAVGRVEMENLDLERVSIFLGDTQLVCNGELDEHYTEERGQIEMDQDEITVEINLARGNCSETVWTSDLSHDYIRINAEYRT
ncbi:MAG: bifunctional glutamate N-acetyltransferase/amino-acid acetyltransferase ArgJ [Proteobacteria bacterium]|nr:bifunctional glutamate N-acetyltransferase/amino-acid acetyltransferase ArgJ [Pseudomonadota bacterium]